MASLPLDAMDSSALPDGWMYGDLDASDILLEYAQIIQPPYLVAGVGLAIGVLCGLTFAKLVENKLEGWETDAMRWRWLVRHASLGFDAAPSWNAVVRLPVFDSDDQTITALVDRARAAVGDA